MILIFLLCVTQGWCAQPYNSPHRNTIATHLDEQEVTSAFRPGKLFTIFSQQIQDDYQALQVTATEKTRRVRSRINKLLEYLSKYRQIYSYHYHRLSSHTRTMNGFGRTILAISIIIFITKPVLGFMGTAFSRGPTSVFSYSLDSPAINTLIIPQLADSTSLPDSLRCHFFNYDADKFSVTLVFDQNIPSLPPRISVTHPFDYDVLDSIAQGKISADDYWRRIAQESVRWYSERGGREALALQEMDEILASVPRIKIPYRVKTRNGYVQRTYLKPDRTYLRALADSLPPLPDVVVPIQPENESIEKMQAIIKNSVDNNLPVSEKVLTGPMTHFIAHYLRRAGNDLEVFILPVEYLTGMYTEAHPDFFLIEWLNAQRHPQVDSTTALIEIHLEANVLGFGNCAYPKLLPKVISRSGNGIAQYSHFLEYPNAEILESMPQGTLVKGSPDFLKVYIAQKVDEVIADLRLSQPNVKKIALIFGHANGTYRSPTAKKPSAGVYAKYTREEAIFSHDTIFTWNDRVNRDEAKGFHYYHNKIGREWLLKKSTKNGNIQGINSMEISQLGDLGVLTWSEDSYPYVSFTDEILRDGKYALFDKMRQMG
jgi:hypothetical protein